MKKLSKRRKSPCDGGGNPKPRKRRGGGRGSKRNATLPECYATPTKLWEQRQHNIGTWLAHAPKQHTAGQYSAPLLTNNNITSQSGRTPTGLTTRNPAMRPTASSRRDIQVGNPEQPRGPGGPKPEAANPTAALKVVEIPAMQPAVWTRGRWS